jgi:hypothetical protein
MSALWRAGPSANDLPNETVALSSDVSETISDEACCHFLHSMPPGNARSRFLSGSQSYPLSVE